MAFGSPEEQTTGREQLTPMQIARNSLFTAREKLDLLKEIKADATGAEAEGRAFGFTSGEIDDAIALVHRDVQDGMGTEARFKGEN